MVIWAILACGAPDAPVCASYDEVFVWVDADEDGFGGETEVGYVCAPGPGQAANNVDCDDDASEIHPDAEEICDLQDNDCNDVVDETFAKVSWYEDADGDGYGDGIASTAACQSPGPQWVDNDGDCDDDAAEIHPGAEEICDLQDNDCDDAVDETFTKVPWYEDADGDGYGSGMASAAACQPPGAGWVDNDGDCNDNVAAVNPLAIEICNDGIDDDCDGRADDADAGVDPSTYTLFYPDDDGDGFGDTSNSQDRCMAPMGWILDGGDCDDTNPRVNVDAPEVCDLVDNDCNGLADNADPGVDPATQVSYYVDGDGDGFGSGAAMLACEPVAGVLNNADCDDLDANVTIVMDWLVDGDGDGYGAGMVVSTDCFPPGPGTAGANVGLDCDDAAPEINPGAPEVCEDGVDNDCSGSDSLCGPVGDFLVSDGPPWSNNPPVYNCLEVCAQLFGGVDTDYACSTSDTVVDNMAFVSGWGDGQFCQSPGAPEDLSKEDPNQSGYDCGAVACSYSAYVLDHCTSGERNYCWEL